jgi:hypothetical protein
MHGTTIKIMLMWCSNDGLLLARSQYAAGRSCDRPDHSRLSADFLPVTAMLSCLLLNIHVVLHASDAPSALFSHQNFNLMHSSVNNIESGLIFRIILPSSLSEATHYLVSMLPLQ